MATYKYDIKTTAGEAFGTIEASDESAAKDQLTAQYSGDLHDEDGNTTTNEVISIQLSQAD